MGSTLIKLETSKYNLSLEKVQQFELLLLAQCIFIQDCGLLYDN